MSRTPRREYVTQPIAVQMTVTRAMMPVTPSTPVVLDAISCTCAGLIAPVSLIRPGM